MKFISKRYKGGSKNCLLYLRAAFIHAYMEKAMEV